MCRSSIADGCNFQLGKANQLRDGKDVTLIANGLMVSAALEAAERLAGQGIQARVLDMHTVKPLDDAAVLAAARDTGRIVVAEEHLLHGGLGSAVAMSAARQHPVPMRFVGLKDTFAESGTPEELLAKYGLTAGASNARRWSWYGEKSERSPTARQTPEPGRQQLDQVPGGIAEIDRLPAAWPTLLMLDDHAVLREASSPFIE